MIVVIGSGIAGLACARLLAAAGLSVVVLDKGRGIGGRMATKRIGDLQFDHGAQFVTARDPGFAQALAAIGVKAWQDGSGQDHLVGVPGMSSIAQAFGAGLNIRQGTEVTGLRQDAQGWLVQAGEEVLRAARVVLTLPAPQVAGLLGAGHPMVPPLAEVRLAPCLTLMASVAAEATFITRRDPDDPLSWIAQDSSKPGRPQGPRVQWVAQAGEAFSLDHLDKPAEEIAALMLPLLCDRLGVSPGLVTEALAHRWRYARVTQALGDPFLRSPDGTLYLGGDWCLGPRVEAAWTSGTAIAGAILADPC